MDIKQTFIRLAVAGAVATLAGCATNSNTDTNAALESELQGRAAALDSREASLQQRESALSNTSQIANANISSDLLPPNAKSGECYARVWVPETFKNVNEKLLATEASERVEVIPATYAWTTETVEVKQASSKLVNVPAVYGSETETIQTRAEQLIWRLDLGRNSAPASNELLSLAKKYGADLDSATPGMCFHEHTIPAKFETVTQKVLSSEESGSINIVPATYRTVEKTVLVSEASSKIVEVPATYKTESSKILVKPAYTIWKKGTGPIQRIDSATGEIMCLVEIPAEYKTVSKKVIATPATIKTIEIPAKYKTVKVRELVTAASQTTTKIPAKYKTVSKQKKVADATVTWHEIHNLEEPKETRTGQKVCLTKTPAAFKTVTRKVVVTPATTREVVIPAESKTVKVRKLQTAASEKRIAIPATYKTVSRQELVTEGFMQWRSILCETNTTPRRIAQIQSALKAKGYNPGPIDGDVGAETMQAVNAFQKANKLPVDKYLNVETIRALGVSVK
jgi:hypothetical protein